MDKAQVPFIGANYLCNEGLDHAAVYLFCFKSCFSSTKMKHFLLLT